jgi:predicted dehydrogenase
MRFAILGNHPDGLLLAGALIDSGRHALVAYTAEPTPEQRARWGDARRVGDIEEILADPAVELVVIAGSALNRPEQLRRALQAERHVLCVHPADQTPDVAYEAAMLRADAGVALLPLLTAPLHPGLRRLRELCRGDGPLGPLVLLEADWEAKGEALVNAGALGQRPSFPCWPALRALGGEVAEVTGFAEKEEVAAGAPVVLAGRFEGGGLFRVTLLPGRADARRFRAVCRGGRAELFQPQGDDGPAFLAWAAHGDEETEESWERPDPWPTLVTLFESALPGADAPLAPPPLAWQDEVRCLELDDAARRSVERRRSSTLEYQEASEEVGFKGTMTLVGCGLIQGLIVLLVLAVWLPAALWLAVPALLAFLLLQLLRYAVPQEPHGPTRAGGRAEPAPTEKYPP